MILRLRPYGLSGCLAVLVLAACSNGTQSVASKYVASAVIDSSGGTIAISKADDATLAGTTIVIPKGALSASTTISIGFTTDSVAQKGQVAAGPVVDFEPSGTVFLAPVTITLPTTATSSSTLQVEAVEADGSTKTLAVTSLSGGLVTFDASGFTNFGAISGGSSSGTCSTDADCPTNEACVGPTSEINFEHCVAVTASTCPEGQTECSGTCADLTSDTNNCGACGNACPSGSTCDEGACAGSTTVTPDASTGCSTDADCGSGSECVSGECVTAVADACAPTTCATLGLTCGTASDGCGGTLNCGACDDAGVDGATDATTCAAGETDCSGTCIDLTSDSSNCGACGAMCATGTTCSEGVCGG